MENLGQIHLTSLVSFWAPCSELFISYHIFRKLSRVKGWRICHPFCLIACFDVAAINTQKIIRPYEFNQSLKICIAKKRYIMHTNSHNMSIPSCSDPMPHRKPSRTQSNKPTVATKGLCQTISIKKEMTRVIRSVVAAGRNNIVNNILSSLPAPINVGMRAYLS